jgi:hypothetical protein
VKQKGHKGSKPKTRSSAGLAAETETEGGPAKDGGEGGLCVGGYAGGHVSSADESRGWNG